MQEMSYLVQIARSIIGHDWLGSSRLLERVGLAASAVSPATLGLGPWAIVRARGLDRASREYDGVGH
jgi:hypothetical protein